MIPILDQTRRTVYTEDPGLITRVSKRLQPNNLPRRALHTSLTVIPVAESFEAEPGIRNHILNQLCRIGSSEAAVSPLQLEGSIVVMEGDGRLDPDLEERINLSQTLLALKNTLSEEGSPT